LVVSGQGGRVTTINALPLLEKQYGPGTLVVLHWFLALLIIAALALGALVMVKIPNTDPMKIEALRSHMSGGILILGALPKDFWVYPVRTVHYAFSRLLMALIALHIAGALYHTFILKDGLLRRMFFGRRALPAASVPPAEQPLSRVQP
jgi:cytochrome b561